MADSISLDDIKRQCNYEIKVIGCSVTGNNWIKKSIDSESARHGGVDNLYGWLVQLKSFDVNYIIFAASQISMIPANARRALISVGTIKHLVFVKTIYNSI